ncbi:unnamed protein product [Kuraishia capsulata CBS 1993]|uniref:Uncharacterized protein n=1 Tax=Kuraishia capsulata CBS 1993 TaxID=1382522 RepID=W6MHK5_9ASCO|nr:uncharacterized protein KUCA_T00001170001 [Kuraishia capsulata CBS 1993]CDK25203.1 unnamed protein product [Kuraishia capsulata CBS 1993]
MSEGNSATNTGYEYLSGSGISKAVATTASVLVNSGGYSTTNALSQNKIFQKAVNGSIHSNKSHALLQKHAVTGEAVSLIRRSKRVPRNHKPKDFLEVPDELLNDIPGDDEVDHAGSSFSLFQGFTAVLPEVQDAIDRVTEGSSKLLAYDGPEVTQNALPRGITVEKIKSLQNPKQLNDFKDQINWKLDLLEIRKGLASSEIHEIDHKIEKLQQMRNSVFQRISRFEQDEAVLESSLNEIEWRLDLVKDVDVSSEENQENEAEFNDENEDSFVTISGETTVDYDADDSFYEDSNANPLMTKSIYGKLQNETRKIKKRVPSRKVKPTLQQYYTAGSRIRGLKAHEDSVTCFDFDQPFGTMVSASLDNTVRVWDLSRGKCTGLLEGHLASVRCLQMEENVVVTGSLDASLKLWDISKLHDDDNDGCLITTFESHVEEISALSFHNTTLLSGSTDRTIRQWDMNTGHCLQTIDVMWASSMMNGGDVSSSAADWQKPLISGDYPFIGALQCYDAALATGTADGLVRLWDLRSGEIIRQLVGHTGPVTALQFDNKNLATGSADRSIRLWDLRTGGIVDAFAYDSPISTLQFDDSKIVVSNGESTVKVYDRIEERHWTCGPGVSGESSFPINCAKYHEGYMIEGRGDGAMGIWAI